MSLIIKLIEAIMKSGITGSMEKDTAIAMTTTMAMGMGMDVKIF